MHNFVSSIQVIIQLRRAIYDFAYRHTCPKPNICVHKHTVTSSSKLNSMSKYTLQWVMQIVFREMTQSLLWSYSKFHTIRLYFSIHLAINRWTPHSKNIRLSATNSTEFALRRRWAIVEFVCNATQPVTRWKTVQRCAVCELWSWFFATGSRHQVLYSYTQPAVDDDTHADSFVLYLDD